MPQKKNQLHNETNIKIAENGVDDATFTFDCVACEGISNDTEPNLIVGDHKNTKNNEIPDHCSNGEMQITSNCSSLTCCNDEEDSCAGKGDAKESSDTCSATVLQNHTNSFNQSNAPHCDSFNTIDLAQVDQEPYIEALSFTNLNITNVSRAPQLPDVHDNDPESLDSESSETSLTSNSSIQFQGNYEVYPKKNNVDNNERLKGSFGNDLINSCNVLEVNRGDQDELSHNKTRDSNQIPLSKSAVMREELSYSADTNAISSPAFSESGDSETLSNSDQFVNNDRGNSQLLNPTNADCDDSSDQWAAIPEAPQKGNGSTLRPQESGKITDKSSIQIIEKKRQV